MEREGGGREWEESEDWKGEGGGREWEESEDWKGSEEGESGRRLRIGKGGRRERVGGDRGLERGGRRESDKQGQREGEGVQIGYVFTWLPTNWDRAQRRLALCQPGVNLKKNCYW